MKAHIGVDSKTKLIHLLVATAANVADNIICRICCMAKKPVSGVTRRIVGSKA